MPAVKEPNSADSWATGETSRTRGGKRGRLETRRDDALQKLCDNSGRTVVSTAAHGVSFSAASDLRWDQWFALLDVALRSLDRNGKIPGAAQGRLR